MMRLVGPLALLLHGAALAQAPIPSAVPPRGVAYTEEIQAAFSRGVALLGVQDGYLWVEHYQPGGAWRGSHRGRDYAGRWSAENELLCTQAAGAARSCVTVYVRPSDLREQQVVPLVLRDATGPVLEAELRVRAASRPSAPGEVQGEVVQVWQDGFRVAPAAGGPALWVRVARPVPDLFPPDRVTMQGQSDGLVFTATGATRHATPGR